MRNFFICILTLTTCLTTAFAQPRIYVRTMINAIDVASSEQEISKVITIANKGDSLLHLGVEKTSCGCTGATLSTESLAPGQSGTITIKMQVSGWGTKTETVTLTTNDPKQPHPVITLQAKMPATIVPSPDRLMIQTHEGGVAQRFLSLLLPNKATVANISARNPALKVKILDSQFIEGGTLQRIEVLLDASATAGEFKDELTIDLKNAPVSRISVAIEVLVAPDISIEPRQVFLGQVSQGTIARKVVIVQSRGKHPFSIAKIESGRPNIVSKADPKIIADAHSVEIDVAALGKPGSFLQDNVKMTLSNGRVLEVPITGMIVKPSANATTNLADALRVGSPAPDFTTTDSNGNPHKLSDLHSQKNLLLTFFPKCFTGGCAGHLASLQQALPNFARADTEVWAVSVDPASEQVAFATKLGLQFPLLPDTERTLSMLFGAAQSKSDMAVRQSILIDKQGIVRWVDTDVHVQTHGADVLAKINELGLDKKD